MIYIGLVLGIAIGILAMIFVQRRGKQVKAVAGTQPGNDPFDTTVSIGLAGIQQGHHNTTYRGVACVKAPFDYVIYQMIIAEVKPDLIIEIGSFEGGSALYLADLLELSGKGELHTIDVENRIDARVRDHNRIKFFFDGWENYDLNLVKQYNTVLVIEDGSHKYGDTFQALRKFSKVVSLNSYLIVEDGIIDALGLTKEYKGGPVRAIKQFLSENNNFEIAYNWSDFFGKNATFNTIGYLRRVS
jgi:cephalosporin hydroxylase